ncbi:MAG: gliding motility-associated ABC transporter substrate-binding protein GldG [Flavobacteriaceae bacterium]|nr:gliding motility-associated ABC transporter substrate-binding protein GldG [Flavobacteriaceae bacterium]
MKRTGIHIVLVFIALVAINFVASKLYKRFDLTSDKRYTLSKTTENIVKNLQETAFVNVYLEGDFPAEFKRLQIETKQHLEELSAINSNIKFRFIDPIDDAESLIKEGLEPSRLSVQEGGKVSEAVIFPWATIEYKDKKENISLLASQTTGSQEEQLQNSIQNLEYAFSDAIHKVTSETKQKIAILKGNGELEDIYLAGFLLNLRQYYILAPFTLDSVNVHPQKTLEQLTDYNLTIIAKPTEKFSEAEKFTLDQYITNGGKTLWLIDNVTAELDSLMQSGQSVVINKDLNLTDQLFSYGVRINYTIVRDAYSSMIRLASGNVGDKAQYQDFLWPYYPLVTSQNNHPITKNIDRVNLKFANSIDTLKNGIKKTVLLQSSEVSKAVGTPFIISLEEVAKKPSQEDYNIGNQILGVLLEGAFTSAYNNRVKPFETPIYKEKSSDNKMIVIADGDVIANEVYQGQPLQLGVDKWTNIRYGNADFLMNAINYMLDDTGLLQLRSKTIHLKFLDKQKAYNERTFWQTINVAIPLALLAIFGIIYTFIRKRKYS